MSNLGHFIRHTRHTRTTESMAKLFGRPDTEADDGETGFVNLDAGAHSAPPPRPLRLGDWMRDALLGDEDYERKRRRTLWG
jgi:hypothetical protein